MGQRARSGLWDVRSMVRSMEWLDATLLGQGFAQDFRVLARDSDECLRRS